MPIPVGWRHWLLALLRIVAGLGFMHHGTAKMLNFPEFSMALNPMTTIAGVLELVGGAMIVIGLFTRPVAFILSGLMAAAYFIVHMPKGFYPSENGGEVAMLYCFIFLYLAAAGSGAWSVDSMRSKNTSTIASG